MKNSYPCLLRSFSRAVLIALIFSLPFGLAAAVEPPPTFLIKWGSFGWGDNQFRYPTGVAVDSSGNVTIASRSSTATGPS
jgi:hypothetical protein